MDSLRPPCEPFDRFGGEFVWWRQRMERVHSIRRLKRKETGNAIHTCAFVRDHHNAVRNPRVRRLQMDQIPPQVVSLAALLFPPSLPPNPYLVHPRPR